MRESQKEDILKVRVVHRQGTKVAKGRGDGEGAIILDF
jgi:hypothetical protein